MKYCNLCSDGLVGQDIILEIKCPYAAKDTTSALEAVERNLVCMIIYDKL